MQLTPRLERAIKTATVAHRKQTRKGGDIPYIIHPFGVMCIASGGTDDEDILIACLFHDILEDVSEEYSRTQMLADYGERVTSIVDGVTKNSELDSWQARADSYLHHLEHEASSESVIVSCADKIHNLMSTLEDYDMVGNKLWERFNAGRDKQLWWYEQIHRVVSQRLPDLSINKQLGDLVITFQSLPR